MCTLLSSISTEKDNENEINFKTKKFLVIIEYFAKFYVWKSF